MLIDESSVPIELASDPPDGMNLKQRIEELGPWFHNIRINGIETAPSHFLGNYPEVKYRHFKDALPRDLSGWSVLDIGCSSGFYSLEMKKRGAAQVIAIDTNERYLDQAQFAAQVAGLEIDFRHMAIWEIAKLGQKFDLVIFMGVLYHLRHPLLALDLIHEHAAKNLLLFQTMQRGSRVIEAVAEDYDFTDGRAPFDKPGFPKIHFVEQRYSGDPTNWWIPNRACSEAMLRSSGFRIESQPEEEVYLCRWQSLALPPDGSHCVYPSQDTPEKG
ncbi:Methyltransferase type 11 [Acidisarcina polymorpha]|uniref:Methyltransferase type 11 n=2 Tax=Acidisarcina polymorpha TaxID=2211140 RepID=A0A2Z5G7G1_9BACT|nr:Methyltransferase type 11 [Acidisarcina polymorpha]